MAINARLYVAACGEDLAILNRSCSISTVSDGDGWGGLGKQLIRARVRQGFKTRSSFARHLDPLKPTRVERILTDLETGARDNYNDSTIALYEEAYGFPPGAFEEIRAGRDYTRVIELMRPQVEDFNLSLRDYKVREHRELAIELPADVDTSLLTAKGIELMARHASRAVSEWFHKLVADDELRRARDADEPLLITQFQPQADSSQGQGSNVDFSAPSGFVKRARDAAAAEEAASPVEKSQQQEDV